MSQDDMIGIKEEVSNFAKIVSYLIKSYLIVSYDLLSLSRPMTTSWHAHVIMHNILCMPYPALKAIPLHYACPTLFSPSLPWLARSCDHTCYTMHTLPCIPYPALQAILLHYPPHPLPSLPSPSRPSQYITIRYDTMPTYRVVGSLTKVMGVKFLW